MNFETIVITAVFGSLAGWLTGVVTKRGGYELLEDTALGVVGGVAAAFILVIARRMFWNVETAATQ